MSLARPLLYINCAVAAPEIGLFAGGSIEHLETVARAPEDPRGLCLFSAIVAMLRAARLSLADVEAVAAGCGPGMLTGTRVGIAAAQALARGAGLAVVALSEFFAYADPLDPEPQTVRVPLGRLGTVQASVQVRASGWTWSDPRLLAPDATVAARTSAVAMAAAAAVAPRQDPAALAPIYLRDPDVRPQTDARGNPLVAGV